MRAVNRHDEQVLLGLVVLAAERHSLDGRLSPRAALVVGHLSGLVDRWIEPVAAARSREALERAVDEAMVPVFEGVLALTFVVLSELGRPAEELGRELLLELKPERLAAVERLGPSALGNTLQALHTLRNALLGALKGDVPAPTPDVLRPYVRLLVALAALQRADVAAPDLLALFARQQAADFSGRLKALTSRPTDAQPPRGAVVSDPSDVAYARAAMRAWLTRSEDGRDTAAR